MRTAPRCSASSSVAPELAVDGAEVGLGDAAVAFEVRRVDGGLARRSVGREDVADRVGALDVEHQDIRLQARPEILGEPVVDAGLDEDSPQRAHRLGVGVGRGGRRGVLRLVEPRKIGAELVIANRALAAGERFSRSLVLARRPDHSGARSLAAMLEREQSIGDHDAVHRLGGVRRPHAEDGDGAPCLRQHGPQRRHPPFRAGDRLALAAGGREASEIQDAVLERAAAGHHGCPEERR